MHDFAFNHTCLGKPVEIRGVSYKDNSQHRELYNRRNSLQHLIPPILGAFTYNEKNILLIELEQGISQ